LGIRTIPCIFGEERRINKLWCVFCVWKRGKTCRKHPGRGKNSEKMISFLVWRVPRAFYSPDTILEATALQGTPPSNGLWLGWSWHHWKDLDFLFLERYETWKSNGQIKSYGSRKLVVHRSVRYSDFNLWIVVGMRIW